MFTGIITHQGTVRRCQAWRENTAITLVIPRVRLHGGDSVAVNGVCLTVAGATGGQYKIVIMPETLRHTALRYLEKGDKVNVELPLKHGQPYGGHFVLGHVDTTGKVDNVKKGRGGTRVRIALPSRFRHLVASKGSIAVDGVSLTVASAGRNRFSVALIPHTVRHTTLGTVKAGDLVNIEFDIFARYIHAASR